MSTNPFGLMKCMFSYSFFIYKDDNLFSLSLIFKTLYKKQHKNDNNKKLFSLFPIETGKKEKIRDTFKIKVKPKNIFKSNGSLSHKYATQ